MLKSHTVVGGPSSVIANVNDIYGIILICKFHQDKMPNIIKFYNK